MHFDADNLSQDVRLHALLRLAIQNMVNVHTLRIIYGHWKFTNALLAGFLDEARPRRAPLRKLWLESCCFDKDAEYRQGDLKTETFRQLWRGPKYQRFRGSLLKGRDQIEMCRNCSEGTKVWG